MNYPVDIHSHTVASTHAYSTIHDYIAEAKCRGITLFATTDQRPELSHAPHFWHFINLRVLPRIVDGVGILRGIEANIKNVFGDIDCSERMRDGLDIVLAGFHEPVYGPSDRESHTRALINTIRSGKVDVITHPGNPTYPIDIPAVVAGAAQQQVAPEGENSLLWHSRQGTRSNCLAIVEAARDLGATLVLGSDAHVAFSLGDFSLAQQLIEQANFPAERLLNQSPRQLLAFLERRGHPAIPELASW